MENDIIYDDKEKHIVELCKRIRHLARLGRINLAVSEYQDGKKTHLFKYLEYCGVHKDEFVKNYLSNLQPYMISEYKEQENSANTSYVVDNIYRIPLFIKIDATFEEKIIVSFCENYEKSVTNDNGCFIKNEINNVKIIADSLTGGITDTNTKTFNTLIPGGIINVPISLIGELQSDDTILVRKDVIENALLDICNQYIQDLYTSDINLPALDELEIFSAIQQIPYTSLGNNTFSNISLLVDNICTQSSLFHKKSACFALETYASHLILTAEQKKELIHLITEKYEVTNLRNADDVINMLVDIIENIEPEKLIIENDPITGEIEPDRLNSTISVQEVKIKFDFSHGPIWKDKYNELTGKWTTGIDIIDNDKALSVLNDEAEREYSSLYSIDENGSVIFDEKAFEQKKATLSSLVQTIILRLNKINDGTFKVVNEENSWLKI